MGISFGTSNVYGDIDNQPGATIALKGNSNVTFWDDLANDGTVDVAGGSTAVYFGAITGVGSFTGSGMTVVEGGLSPGNSPGTMNFAGDVVLGSDSTTLMELGTADFDQLILAGNTQIDGGTLDVDLFDGFMPLLGDQFQIFSFGGEVDGPGFDAIDLPLLGPGLTWETDNMLITGILEVSVIPGSLLGDCTGDGFVGSGDLGSVLNDWGNGPPQNMSADKTGDGFVGSADLSPVLNDWGKSVGAGTAVPEPTTVAMTLFALLLILAVRYRNVGC